MKKLLAILVLGLLVFQSSSQATEIDLDQKIPLYKEITYGKLENGLTYYIKKNSSPKEKATIHLVVKAGSLMEDDDQLGLAHLIEHMVFNGTKNFPKNEIDKYFNSIGLSIGADFNAFTGYETTVYKFNIPTEKKEFIEKGIHILSEISNFANLDDESFDKERKIVEEEWRIDLGKDKRLFDEIKKYYYLNSKFSKRTPIGDINIIRNFSYETAIRFYNDWYRPDLMAVIAVGDFDSKYVESLIKKFFSNIKAKSNRSSPEATIPKYNKTIFLTLSDPEQKESLIIINNKNKKLKLETIKDFKNSYIRDFCLSIIQKRLSSSLQDKKTPLIDAFIWNSDLTSENEFYSYGAILKEKEIEKGIDFLLTELERVKQNGFLPKELEIEKKDIISFYEQLIKSEKTEESDSLVAEYTRNFLENEFVSGPKEEYKIVKKLLPTITVSDLNNHFLNWFKYDDRIVSILLPEKIKDVISEKEFINIEEKVKKYKLSQFKSLYKDELLIKDNLPGSKIIFTKKYPSINTREFRLENGIRVFLKPTKNEEKSFTFEAISMGGYSHANLIDLQSAKILNDVILESSLGNFSRAELNNKINPSFVDAEVWVDPFQEGLSGQTITKYTKELFELIYLNFTSVNFNEVLLENIKSRLREEIRNENLDPNRVFYKKLIHAFYQNHPRRKPQTLEDIDQIKLDKIKNFYKERFADSSDFIFSFVGDFSIDEMKPYIEKYLGSLPNINRNENFIDHNVRKENKSQYIEVRENSEEKSINYRIYTHEIKNNIKNRTALYVLKNALNRILYEEIRENRNLVYSIQANILRIDHFPTQSYSFVIVFESDPKNNSLVFIEIDRILEKFRNNDFEESYIEEAKLHRINELKELMQSNSFLANAMTTYLYENQPITTINNLYDAVKSITSYEINKFSKKTFTENFIQAILLPKN